MMYLYISYTHVQYVFTHMHTSFVIFLHGALPENTWKYIDLDSIFFSSAYLGFTVSTFGEFWLHSWGPAPVPTIPSQFLLPQLAASKIVPFLGCLRPLWMIQVWRKLYSHQIAQKCYWNIDEHWNKHFFLVQSSLLVPSTMPGESFANSLGQLEWPESYRGDAKLHSLPWSEMIGVEKAEEQNTS